jgi:hypothetical protein
VLLTFFDFTDLSGDCRSDEPISTRYKHVQDLLRPRAIPGIRPTAVAQAYARHAATAAQDPASHTFWRGFDFSQFLARPGERLQKTGTSKASEDRGSAVPAADPDRFCSSPGKQASFSTARQQALRQDSQRRSRDLGSPAAAVVRTQRGQTFAADPPELPRALAGQADLSAPELTKILKTHTSALVRHAMQLEQARAMGNHRFARATLAKGAKEMDTLEQARQRARVLTAQPLPGGELHSLLEANDRCNEHIKRWKRLVIAEPVRQPVPSHCTHAECTLS